MLEEFNLYIENCRYNNIKLDNIKIINIAGWLSDYFFCELYNEKENVFRKFIIGKEDFLKLDFSDLRDSDFQKFDDIIPDFYIVLDAIGDDFLSN